jgi:hypothetical protein
MFGRKGGSGQGLAPTRGRIILHMTQHICIGPNVLACAHFIVLHCIAIHYIAMYFIYILRVCVGFETTTRVLNVGAGSQRKLHSFQTV